MVKLITIALITVGEKMEEIMEKNIICRRCHRKLKDEKSIELGFGKTCYQKYLNRKKSFLFEMEIPKKENEENGI